MPEGLRISLLGAVEVTRNGKQVRGFESRKALALLGYLISQSQPVSRTQLADLFWGDKSESQARSNLSRVLHNLSRLLPDSFVSDRHTIEFARASNHWVDLAAFQELASQGTAESLAAAASLYHDEFMTGIYLDDCPDFEIWLVAQREYWRQRVAQVLGKLINYHRDCGDYEAALHSASRLIELEPWHEEAHAQMMRLLAQTGQRSAALKQYEIARKAIADQLGVEPGHELQSLYERLRAGGTDAAGEPRAAFALRSLSLHNLPVQLTSFVARENEVCDILEHLRNPACRLLTLVGPPGAGKTRLALEASVRLTESFPNGIYFVSLSSIAEPRFLVSAINISLGFSSSGPEDPRIQLLDYLAGKKLLLVLDNFEHLLEGAGFLMEILQNAPEVKILVTSQERLNLSAEWLLYVEGLKFPRVNTKEPVEGYAAVKLFLDRAKSVEPHFVLSSNTRPAVIRICQLVEGLPLGIELATAWVGKFSCAHIQRELERNLDFLTTSVRDVPARHRNLRAALEWSYGLLRDPERVLLRRLGAFAGHFSLEAASKICIPVQEHAPGSASEVHEPAGLTGTRVSDTAGDVYAATPPADLDGRSDDTDESASGVLRGQIPTLLSQLVDKSLVGTDSTSEQEVRFVLLQPIRKFALRHLSERGELGAIQGRHAQYFLEQIEKAEPLFRTAEREEWLQRIDAEYDDLRAALEWSVADRRRTETAVRLVAALSWYWYFRSLLDEGRAWVDRLLVRVSDLPPTAAQARFFYCSGVGAWLQGNYDFARTCLMASLKFARALDDRSSTAYALTFLGLVAMNQGHLVEARRLQEESGALFKELGDRWGLALSLTNLELVASQLGDIDAGRAAIEQAVRIFGELRDPWGEGVALDTLGLSAYRRGDYAVAREQLEQAIKIRRKVGEKWLLAQSLSYLGNVLLAQCDYAKAYACFVESMSLNRELGNKHGTAELLSSLALLAAATGRPERAARVFASAEALRAAIGSPMPDPDRAGYDRIKATARAQTGESLWIREQEQGQMMSLEQAVTFALEQPIGE